MALRPRHPSARGLPRRRTPHRRRGAPAELPSGYRVEEAYRYLKTRIMSAALPPGTSLNELGIAGALGISRTPVRFQRAGDERVAIVAALRARDADGAAAAMRQHLASAREDLVFLT